MPQNRLAILLGIEPPKPQKRKTPKPQKRKMPSPTPTVGGSLPGRRPRPSLRINAAAPPPGPPLGINAAAPIPRSPPPGPQQTGESAAGRGVRRARAQSPTSILTATNSDDSIEDYELPVDDVEVDSQSTGATRPRSASPTCALKPLAPDGSGASSEHWSVGAHLVDDDVDDDDEDEDFQAAIEESRVTIQKEEETRAAYAANRQMNEAVNEWLDAVAPADDTDEDLPKVKPAGKAADIFGKGKEVIILSSDDEEA